MHAVLVSLLLVSCILLAWPAGAPEAADALLPMLKPCPSSPNCVSSLAATKRHKIEPLRLQQSAAKTMQLLKEVIAAYPRTKVIADSGTSLHAEFRVNTGFIDDVFFVIDEAAGVVHVRSASRLGYWDFGANRKRIEKFRLMYNERAGRQ